MRWMLALGLAAFMFFGCEDEESAPQLQVVLVEAPTRLPYMTNSWDAQPLETTAVRFIARLEPEQGDVDSILCGIIDINGDQIDSFVLLDDGGQIEHWDHSTAESVLSLDSIAGDGLYTRGVYTYPSVTNFRGEQYTIDFRAIRDDEVLARVEHHAETWMPWVEMTYSAVPASHFTLCDDSAVFTFVIARDVDDLIEEVRVGYRGSGEELAEGGSLCTATWGDSIWSGSVSSRSNGWQNAGQATIYALIRTRLGYVGVHPLVYRLISNIMSPDFSDTPGQVQLSSLDVMDTIYVMAEHFECAERGIVGRAQCYVSDIWSNSSIELTRIDFILLDCGTNGDENANDGVHTGRIGIRATELTAPVSVEVSIISGFAETENCDVPDSHYEDDRLDVVTITVLPPD